MLGLVEDPQNYLLKRKSEMDRLADNPEAAAGLLRMDTQELEEREEAAYAYAEEEEKHFVDYCHDCIKQSDKASEGIRTIQAELWDAYNENMPTSYSNKEPWQAKIIIPRPFQTVQYGAAAVKKAFSPNFLSIENYQNKDVADFWQGVMEFYLNSEHAGFPLKFTDASVMALAIGVSMEMIPRWVPGKGLEITLVEPWKIKRDPDALSRDPQSGMFWVHQEWLDFFVLKEGEKKGRFFDVDRVKECDENQASTDDPFMTKEAIRARKEQVWDDRSQFRKLILTSEFWGMVLDPKGNLLLPSAKYTISGGRLIQKPKATRYNSLRWPGISFSPMPDILRHGGSGLLRKSVLTIWQAMNDIMCLHKDNISWVVNPMVGINTDALVDPTDVNTWPGKEFLERDTPNGTQAVRVVERKSRTNEVLANTQYYDQHFQRGTFVPDNVQGLPGWRQDITFREAAMNLDQALGVYSLMGENLEQGALMVTKASLEIISAHAGLADYKNPFTNEEFIEFAKKFGMAANPEQRTGMLGLPPFDGNFHISGIQALMKDNDTLQNLKTVVIPLKDSPSLGKYINGYKALKAIEKRTNLEDEEVIVTEDEAKMIDYRDSLMAAKQKDAMEKLQELQEALGIAELIEKLKDIQNNDIERITQRIDQLQLPEKTGEGNE